MTKNVTKTEIAYKKRKKFLEMLAKTGRVIDSARAVGYTDTTTLHKYRAKDEEFAKEWDIAVQSYGDILEAEADRRAREGVLEPNFYKGAVSGYTVKYSDTLLQFLMRGNNPKKYRENTHNGQTNINFGVAILPIQAKSDDDWEKRAVTMHSNQTVIELDAKPVENTRLSVKRGD